MSKLSSFNFIQKSSIQEEEILTLDEFKASIMNYTGHFVVDEKTYDSAYFGPDNIYLSFAFNYITGKAVSETLFLVNKIKKLSDSKYVLIYENTEEILLLKE